MIFVSSPHLVRSFFKSRLGLYEAEDLQGILWVSEEYTGKVMDMDHVGVGIAYNAFIGRVASIHIVIQDQKMFTKKVLHELFRHAFKTINLNYLYAPVDTDNKDAMEFVPRVGFHEVHRVPNGGLVGDLVLFGMSKSECRWLKESDNG